MKLLIGSNNPAKLAGWKECSSSIEFVTPRDLNLSVSITEGIISLEDNAKLKAETYMKASGLPVLSDDRGLFIKELNGEPGIAARRWGGLLPDNVSDEDYRVFLKKKIMNLKDTTTEIKFAVAYAHPEKETEVFTFNLVGHIDMSKFDEPYREGYPFDTIFISNTNEAELINKKKKEIIEKIKVV